MDDRLQTVRRVYDGFARGDLTVLDEVLAPDVEFVNPEHAIEPGTRRGVEQFRAAVQGLLDLFDYSSIDLPRINEIGDSVIVEFHVSASGKGSGAPVEVRFGHVWDFDKGLVGRFEWFRGYEEAVAAAGGVEEQGDAGLVRRLYDLWTRGAYEEALAAIDPAIEWVEPPDAPESDTHLGPEGILFSTDRWRAGFEDWSMEIERVRDLGEGKVLVEILQRGRGRGSSVDVEAMVFHLWTVTEGRAVRMQMFMRESEALAAAAGPSRPEDRA